MITGTLLKQKVCRLTSEMELPAIRVSLLGHADDDYAGPGISDLEIQGIHGGIGGRKFTSNE